MKTKYCIYFFRNREQHILYIGKTLSFKQRMSQHFAKGEIEAEGNSWKKTIDKTSIQVFNCQNATDLEIYETYFINKYKPKFNKDKVYGCIPSFDLPYIEPITTQYVRRMDVKYTLEQAVEIIMTKGRSKKSALIESVQYCKKVYPILDEAIETIGLTTIDVLNYDVKKVRAEIDKYKNKHLIEGEFRKAFPKGWYTVADTKQTIQLIYDNMGLGSKKAKATDLEEVFNIKQTTRKINGKTTKVYNIP